MDSALNRESGTAKAAYLIDCLYNKNEKVGMNLTGNSSKNQPRKAMDANIRDSIIGMVSIMILEILFCMKLEIYKCFMIFWLKHQVAWLSIKYIVWEILEIQLTSLVKICSQLSGDNTEKIWAHRFLAKPKTIEAGGLGEL